MARNKSGLTAGLGKTRNVFSRLFSVFSGIDEDMLEELEEALILSDAGIDATEHIMEELRARIKSDKIKGAEDVKEALTDIIYETMDGGEYVETYPRVIMAVGVNGVGKTTSVGKLAAKYAGMGKNVLIAAADTFRAAASEQLDIWAKRADVPIVRSHEGQDPASVVYDALDSAKHRGSDVILCDTAGRLHNKKNLMNELSKISRVIEKEYPDAQKETLLVLDGTTGQNAVVQAREFAAVTDVSGIVLTKIDGTAKGGVVIAIRRELGLPVRFIGVGEGIDDLKPFDAREFADALIFE